MKDDRRLRLVSGAPPSGPPARGEPALDDLAGSRFPAAIDSDPLLQPPFDDAELAAAVATRTALERGDEPLADLLRAGRSPTEASEPDYDALVQRALDGRASVKAELDEPSVPEERAAAARLRAALEATPTRDDAELDSAAQLAGSLRAAWRPAPITPLRHEVLVARALRSARASRRALLAGVTGVLAVAAALALMLRTPDPAGSGSPRAALPTAPAGAAQASLIRARSTVDLFDPAEPFPRLGGETDRIDRIARARASDLRENRFTTWGVR